VAPKPAGRPAAKDISDRDMLTAVEAFTRVGAPYPTEPFLRDFPPKVVLSKIAKLHRRGLIDVKRHLTREGREAYDAMVAASLEA
jgi:hypothetical protein